jgi:hypothetical protein
MAKDESTGQQLISLHVWHANLVRCLTQRLPRRTRCVWGYGRGTKGEGGTSSRPDEGSTVLSVMMLCMHGVLCDAGHSGEQHSLVVA